VAFRYTGEANINFSLKANEKTNLKEYFSSAFKDYKIPDNFKRVVVSFDSDAHPFFLWNRILRQAGK
jgi:hypothetical protein